MGFLFSGSVLLSVVEVDLGCFWLQKTPVSTGIIRGAFSRYLLWNPNGLFCVLSRSDMSDSLWRYGGYQAPLSIRVLQAKILEWVTVSSSRVWTQVSCIAGGFFSTWVTREAQEYWSGYPILSPGELPDPGIKLRCPALQVDSLPAELHSPSHIFLTLCHL